jgi:PAS domain S-box-containing protein
VNEVIPGSSLKMVMENYSQAIAEKRIIRWEETSDYPNGRVTGVVSIVPVFNDKGICINLVGSVHDITERKLVEENLQISEKKYRNLVENALIGIYTTTLEGQHNFINDAMCKILEYDTIDELLRAPVDTTYKNIAERNKLIETLKKSQKIFNYELELVTKEGKTKDVLVNAFLSGKVITGMIMDISERKRAEKVIRESEEKYRQLLENSGIGVGVFSLEGKIQYLNQKAIHYLGGRTKDYIGRSLPEVFGEQAAEIFLARFQEVVKSDKSIEFEDFVHMDKGDYWFLSNQTRIKSPDGKIIAVQILAHDITERKNAEVELMRNIAELQRFQNLTVGRELTMIKLKKEVNELLKKTGQENKYKIVE